MRSILQIAATMKAYSTCRTRPYDNIAQLEENSQQRKTVYKMKRYLTGIQYLLETFYCSGVFTRIFEHIKHRKPNVVQEMRENTLNNTNINSYTKDKEEKQKRLIWQNVGTVNG